MFHYGLDFHDLAPDTILHISSCIVVCKAFLHVTPHFGLWLKTFNVKSKMIERRHAECGGAIISKNVDAPGQRALFRKYLMYGNGDGSMSLLPGAQSGQLPPSSAQALRHSWRLGPT